MHLNTPTNRPTIDGAARLDFIGFDERDRQALRTAAPTIRKTIRPALDKFYAKVATTPQTARFFKSPAHMTGAKSAQADHWEVITTADFGADYFQRAEAIGRRHAAIGLEPRWYVDGYAIVAAEVIEALIVGGGLKSRKRLAAEVKAFVKALMLDVDLAVSSYQQVSDAEIMAKIGTGLAALSEGDFSHRIDGIDDRFAKLQKDFNRTASQLCDTVTQVTSAVSTIVTGAGEIFAAADDLASRTERQAMSLEQSASVTSQIATGMHEAAQWAGNARGAIESSYNEAAAGEEAVSRAVLAMTEIDKSSKQIANIVDVIDGIAFQTNLLALNAGVEAARAGEAGKGFTVVAGEVRALAQRAAQAAQDIKGLVDSSTRQVAHGVQRANEAGEVIKQTLVGFGRIRTMVADIARRAATQTDDLQQIDSALRAIDQMTQENAAMAEQSTAATRSLASEAQHLGELVKKFQVDPSASRTELRYAA